MLYIVHVLINITLLFFRDLDLIEAYRLDSRPSLHKVQQVFKFAKIVGFAGSITLTVILILIWPLIMMYGIPVLNFDSFYTWVK